MVRLLVPVLAVLFAAPVPQLTTKADDVAWIAGCWTMPRPDGVVEETWLPPAGGAMVGVGRTVRGARMTEFEFLRIQMIEGRLTYIAKPSGQTETAFPVLRASATDIVFENPTHDFPQRVLYKKNADGSLTARIEGTLNGQARGIDFPYVRCK